MDIDFIAIASKYYESSTFTVNEDDMFHEYLNIFAGQWHSRKAFVWIYTKESLNWSVPGTWMLKNKEDVFLRKLSKDLVERDKGLFHL